MLSQVVQDRVINFIWVALEEHRIGCKVWYDCQAWPFTNLAVFERCTMWRRCSMTAKHLQRLVMKHFEHFLQFFQLERGGVAFTIKCHLWFVVIEVVLLCILWLVFICVLLLLSMHDVLLWVIVIILLIILIRYTIHLGVVKHWIAMAHFVVKV